MSKKNKVVLSGFRPTPVAAAEVETAVEAPEAAPEPVVKVPQLVVKVPEPAVKVMVEMVTVKAVKFSMYHPYFKVYIGSVEAVAVPLDSWTKSQLAARLMLLM